MSAVAVSRSLIDQPGTVAFLVIFGMGVILFFLFRSMAKHLRKVNMAARAEAEAAARAQHDQDGADGGPGSGSETGAGGETSTGGETGAGGLTQPPRSGHSRG